MTKIFNIFKGDKCIWGLFLLFCIISIIEVYSASSILTYKTEDYANPILKHIGMLVIGFFAMVMVLHIPCSKFKILIPFLLIFSFIFLIVALLNGESTNGAQRWVSLFGIQFQPSEIAKGTAVLTIAQILSFTQTEVGADKRAFSYILWVCLPLIGLIFFENFSTAALLFAVMFMMMVIGRIPKKYILRLVLCVVVSVTIAVLVVLGVGKTDKQLALDSGSANTETTLTQDDGTSLIKRQGLLHRFDTWKNRITGFLSSDEIDYKNYDWDKNGQKAHARIAIATGGLTGKMPGNSVERDWLPQAFADFIYAIIIEEMGLFGALIVVILYIILLFRVSKIANKCERNFPAFLVLGLGLLICTQAFFNMCVTVGLAPITGQPLPFISKGGTSTVINCIYLGMILSVSHTAKKRKTELEIVKEV